MSIYGVTTLTVRFVQRKKKKASSQPAQSCRQAIFFLNKLYTIVYKLSTLALTHLCRLPAIILFVVILQRSRSVCAVHSHITQYSFHCFTNIAGILSRLRPKLLLWFCFVVLSFQTIISQQNKCTKRRHPNDD